jgi:hypothetical protein
MMVFFYKKIIFFLLLKMPLLYFAQSLQKLRLVGINHGKDLKQHLRKHKHQMTFVVIIKPIVDIEYMKFKKQFGRRKKKDKEMRKTFWVEFEI